MCAVNYFLRKEVEGISAHKVTPILKMEISL
jgi:hypothetical protein